MERKPQLDRQVHRATTLIAVSALAGGIALAGCSAGTASSAGAATQITNGVVNMTLDGPVSTYDPAMVSTYQDEVVEETIYDNLVDLDANGALIAGLADRWSSTTNTATFHLRGGVTCSDGTPLTSADVAASLRRLFDPATKAPLVNEAIGAGNTATVTSTSDSVTISLAKPWSDLLRGMSGPYAGIVCPAGLKNPANLRTASSGTGPYVSASQVAGSSYTFTRRAGYAWGPTYPARAGGEPPKQLVLKVVTDENTRTNLQSSGELQVASYSSNAWNRLPSGPDIAVAVSPQSDTMLVFNESAGHPTAQQSVRLAISQAISRDELNQVQSYGVGKLIDSIGQKTYACYDNGGSALLPRHDPSAAAKALNGVKIRIVGTNILAGGDANNYLLSALRSAGADASVNTTSNEIWVGDLFGGKNDWDITILVYGNNLGSFLSIGQFFTHAAPPNGVNVGGTDNPAAQRAYDAATVASADTKCAQLFDMQEALLKRNDVLPLATAPVHVMFTGGVHGVLVNGFAVPGALRVG